MDHRVRDIFYTDHRAGIIGIQSDSAEAADNEVFLHIQMQEQIHAALEKLPQNADCHRKAECDDSHIEGGDVEVFASPVQEIDQREPHRRKQKAVQGMKNGVPAWNLYIIVIDLAEYLGCEDEGKYDCLKKGRDGKIQYVFQKCRNQKQD